jgi:hypothetical protein
MKGEEMKKEEYNRKEDYVEPKVLASYTRDEIKEIIRPHGQPPDQSGGGGCGCGGGSILVP